MAVLILEMGQYNCRYKEARKAMSFEKRERGYDWTLVVMLTAVVTFVITILGAYTFFERRANHRKYL